MAIVTTSSLPAPVQQSLDLILLSVPTPNLIHNSCAMKKTHPAKGGQTHRFRRYNPLATAKVPLGNTGVTPPGQLLTAVDIDAKLNFYGTYVECNERITLMAQDPVLNELAIRLGVSMRQTEDELMRDMLAGTASFINCTRGVGDDNPTEITRGDVDEVVRTLLNNNAYTVADNIEAMDKFGTAAVRNSYMAMCSTNLTGNLDNVDGFIHNSQYPNQMKVMSTEWGAIGNLRFLVSSIGSVSTAASMLGADVYNIFCVGMESYASIEIDQYAASFIYRPPIYSGPLSLNFTAGWKFSHAARLLNDAWAINLRCTLE